MTPDQTPAAPAPSRLPFPMLTPDFERMGPWRYGDAELGGRLVTVVCPGGSLWLLITPWLNPAGRLSLPAAGTRDRTTCEYALGQFLGSCLYAADLEWVDGNLRAGRISADEVVTAVRENVRLWWPGIDVAMPIE